MTDLAPHRRRIDALRERKRQALAARDREEAALADASERLEAVQEAQRAVQAIAQEVQRQVHRRVAAVVSRCLTAVFDDPYQFEIRFDQKRGKTEAKMVFSRDGLECDDPLNEIGGGCVDVAALALRLACLLMTCPRPRRFCCLDEPFKNVRGRQNKARTRELLVRLSEDLQLQVLISTDIPEYQLGRTVELGHDGLHDGGAGGGE